MDVPAHVYKGDQRCYGLYVMSYSYYDTDIVLIALGITAGVCLAISIFAIQTKVSFG